MSKIQMRFYKICEEYKTSKEVSRYVGWEGKMKEVS